MTQRGKGRAGSNLALLKCFYDRFLDFLVLCSPNTASAFALASVDVPRNGVLYPFFRQGTSFPNLSETNTPWLRSFKLIVHRYQFPFHTKVPFLAGLFLLWLLVSLSHITATDTTIAVFFALNIDMSAAYQTLVQNL